MKWLIVFSSEMKTTVLAGKNIVKIGKVKN